MLGVRSDPPPPLELTCRLLLDCRAARISLIAAATSLDFPPPAGGAGGDVSGAGEGGGSREEKLL